MVIYKYPRLSFFLLLEPFFWSFEIDELHEILVLSLVERLALMREPVEIGLQVSHVERIEFSFTQPVHLKLLFHVLGLSAIIMPVTDVL